MAPFQAMGYERPQPVESPSALSSGPKGLKVERVVGLPAPDRYGPGRRSFAKYRNISESRESVKTPCSLALAFDETAPDGFSCKGEGLQVISGT